MILLNALFFCALAVLVGFLYIEIKTAYLMTAPHYVRAWRYHWSVKWWWRPLVVKWLVLDIFMVVLAWAVVS